MFSARPFCFSAWPCFLEQPKTFSIWCDWPESNRQAEAADFKSAVFTYFTTVASKFGASGETRTLKIWLLRPTRIPIPSPRQFMKYYYTILKFIANLAYFFFTGCDPALYAVITNKQPITFVTAIMSVHRPVTAVPLS